MTVEHISSALSGMGSAINMGSAFANHIWQSTAFAVIVGLLTTLLRKHQARIRFALWLAASIKFLLPFSLLIALGGLLPKPQHIVTSSQTGLYAAIDIAGQPFTVGNVPPIQSAAHAESLLQHLTMQLPLVFAAIWIFGAFVVLLVRFSSWRRVSAILRGAAPVQQGREIRLLRCLEEATGRQGQIALRLSEDRMEPGVLGIFRPVLIWPERLSERLDEEQMEAILAHEMTHLRRRDNLAAAIHMLVEVLFWFHPMVWWMGRRMVEERERACDEAVVRLGNSPEVYAESLLKACRFCVEAPLACVSGVTGSDLKHRIVRIMDCGVTARLNVPLKLLLGAAATLTLALPVCFGLLHARVVHAQGNAMQSKGIENTWRGTLHAGPNLHIAAQSNVASTGSDANQEQLAFDVVSIRRNKSPMGAATTRIAFPSNGDGLTMTDVSLSGIVATFYGSGQYSQSGMPDWANSECYDIQAKVSESDLAAYHKLSSAQRIEMAQAILRDRFKLQVHLSQKEASIYALTIAKNGPRLKEATPGETYTSGPPGPDGQNHGGSVFVSGVGEVTGDAVTMNEFARSLRHSAGREVVDKTGLTGKYDFVFKWNQEQNDGPSLFTALDEQLGLKLEPSRGMVRILVIDHIERPSAN